MRSPRLNKPSRPPVVFRKHARDADERQRFFALAAVEVTVVAGHSARREPRGLDARVREDPEARPDLIRKPRIVQRWIRQRIPRKLPGGDHGRPGGNQRARHVRLAAASAAPPFEYTTRGIPPPRPREHAREVRVMTALTGCAAAA